MVVGSLRVGRNVQIDLWMGLRDLTSGWVYQCVIQMHLGKVWTQSGKGIFKRISERWKKVIWILDVWGG